MMNGHVVAVAVSMVHVHASSPGKHYERKAPWNDQRPTWGVPAWPPPPGM